MRPMRMADALMASLEDVAKLASAQATVKRAERQGVDLHWPVEGGREAGAEARVVPMTADELARLYAQIPDVVWRSSGITKRQLQRCNGPAHRLVWDVFVTANLVAERYGVPAIPVDVFAPIKGETLRAWVDRVAVSVHRWRASLEAHLASASDSPAHRLRAHRAAVLAARGSA